MRGRVYAVLGERGGGATQERSEIRRDVGQAGVGELKTTYIHTWGVGNGRDDQK